MLIEVTDNINSAEWDKFVERSESGTIYHLCGWRSVVQKTFGHSPVYFAAKKDNQIVGVLPSFHMKSVLFGSFLVSMPFFNYGGICSTNEKSVRDLLLTQAVKYAKESGCKHIEFRNYTKYSEGLISKTNKISMVLKLPTDVKILWDSFKPKLRNHIRKAEKSNLKLKIGGIEELDSFYRVFSINMRDLGTPVYPKRFFQNIIRHFPGNVKIFTVYSGWKAVASGFTISYKGVLEIPWGSSLKAYNKLCANPFMYWEIIKYASVHGLEYFDFGRCSKDSSTYIFKKEWGAEPKQLYWDYWLANTCELPEINPNNPKYKLLINLWKKMPVLVANFLGPFIIKYIP